jgi:hypothetical protein
MSTSDVSSAVGEICAEAVLSKERSSIVALAAPLTVAFLLAGLLVGYAPVGLDPDGMYRPIKTELARAMRGGRLPFWSDRLGLGCPLVAESHVAAFYPPNLLYGSRLDVLTVHRLLMWAHYVALAATMYLLGRELGLSPWAAALASLSFTLCGFMASSAAHEPIYTAIPYLPLVIYAACRYAASGQLAWQAGLALAVGVQLTIGHFQIQSWTLALAAVVGSLRALSAGRPLQRVVGLFVALSWGLGIAAVQLLLSYELIQNARFLRDPADLSSFSLPPALLAQPVAPWLFLGYRAYADAQYWMNRGTTPLETCWYVGTIPLALALIGLARSGRPFRFWKALILLALLLTCLPKLSPDVFFQLSRLPGFGTFRAPGRYRMLACLGLCLLAGAGLDTLSTGKRFHRRLLLVVLVAAAGTAWGIFWSRGAEARDSLLPVARDWGLVVSLVSWAVGLWAIRLWNCRRTRPQLLLFLTAVELGLLFYQAPPYWGWPAHPLHRSPILKRLATEADTGLIVGETAGNALFAAGFTPATPYLGIPLPPPNDLLIAISGPVISIENPAMLRWPRRYGVSYGVHREGTPSFPGAHTLMVTEDPVFEQFRLDRSDKKPKAVRWILERYPAPFPPARVLTKRSVAANRFAVNRAMNESATEDEGQVAWYSADDPPADAAEPRATFARLCHWDGTEAIIEHDGPCDLVVRRGFYPGWQARLGGGLWEPVQTVSGGLQGVPVPGRGISHVVFRYRPTYLTAGAMITTLALAACASALVLGNRYRCRCAFPRSVHS